MRPADSENLFPETNLAHPDLPRITCEELKRLLDEESPLLLVDTRGVNHYEEEHIPHAVNIPGDPFPPFTEQMIEVRLKMLPRDRLIILYCDCEDDDGSANSALKLLEAGFNVDKVKVLTKGWNQWLMLGFPTEK